VKVVLDTNVLISGLLRRDSPPDKLRRAWEQHGFTLVTSQWQLEELRRVSRYPKLSKLLRPHEVGRLVGRIRRHAHVLDDLSSIDASPDPDDNPVLATALTGGAEWLVTGDQSDLIHLGRIRGVRIVTAREFLDNLGRAGNR
jgi:putative PIN family toxin of toxin-antitoxin system